MKQLSGSTYWILQLTGWSCLILINTFFALLFNSLNSKGDIVEFAGRLAVFVLLGVVITHFMRILVLRKRLLERPFNTMVIGLILLVVFSTLVFSSINVGILQSFDILKPNEKQFFFKNPLLLILSNAFSSGTFLLIWMLIYVVYHFVPVNGLNLKKPIHRVMP